MLGPAVKHFLMAVEGNHTETGYSVPHAKNEVISISVRCGPEALYWSALKDQPSRSQFFQFLSISALPLVVSYRGVRRIRYRTDP